MLMTQESASTSLVFAARPLPGGAQVLVPVIVRPRTCHRLDGVAKVAYGSRAEAKAARTKHHGVYRCPNCKAFHLATKRRRGSGSQVPRAIRSQAA